MVLSYEETPLSDWFKTNRITITLAVLVIFGGNAYLEYWPRMQAQNNAESWSLYQTISSEVDVTTNLSEKLAQAEQDPLTYQWFVYTTTRLALQSKNAEAQSILKTRLEKLANSDDAQNWVASSNGETRPIANILLDAINGTGIDTPRFDNPTPTGPTYVVSLMLDDTTSYDITISTFSESMATVNHFVANIDGLVGSEITNFNNISLTIENGLEEDAAAIEIERTRLFHAEGVLCTVATSESDGSQKANTLQIMLKDNFFADGQSTVFGVVTSGLDELKEALAGLGNDQTLTVSAVTEA